MVLPVETVGLFQSIALGNVVGAAVQAAKLDTSEYLAPFKPIAEAAIVLDRYNAVVSTLNDPNLTLEAKKAVLKKTPPSERGQFLLQALKDAKAGKVSHDWAQGRFIRAFGQGTFDPADLFQMGYLLWKGDSIFTTESREDRRMLRGIRRAISDIRHHAMGTPEIPQVHVDLMNPTEAAEIVGILVEVGGHLLYLEALRILKEFADIQRPLQLNIPRHRLPPEIRGYLFENSSFALYFVTGAVGIHCVPIAGLGLSGFFIPGVSIGQSLSLFGICFSLITGIMAGVLQDRDWQKGELRSRRHPFVPTPDFLSVLQKKPF